MRKKKKGRQDKEDKTGTREGGREGDKGKSTRGRHEKEDKRETRENEEDEREI